MKRKDGLRHGIERRIGFENHLALQVCEQSGAPAANAAKFTVSKLDEHQNL